jgi:uncharacterized cupin superfamily protein
MSGPIIHWDDVAPHIVRQGPLDAAFRNLGGAAGTVKVGLRRQEIAAGKRALPPHAHTAEEEIFFVLGGSGLCYQGGGALRAGPTSPAGESAAYVVLASDCIVHPPNSMPHTLIAGADGIDVLAFGNRVPTEVAHLPRGHVAWVGPTWFAAGEGDHPWIRDAAAGDLVVPDPSPRPATIVNVEDVTPLEGARADTAYSVRPMGEAAGSVNNGFDQVTLPPGKLNYPPHCHSVEEELYVVLDGDGDCLIQAARKVGWEPKEHPLRRGSIVSFPAGTGVTHALRGGPNGLVYLVFGQRDSADICWYPRSNKVNFRGIKVIGRVEPLQYWDGEE